VHGSRATHRAAQQRPGVPHPDQRLWVAHEIQLAAQAADPCLRGISLLQLHRQVRLCGLIPELHVCSLGLAAVLLLNAIDDRGVVRAPPGKPQIVAIPVFRRSPCRLGHEEVAARATFRSGLHFLGCRSYEAVRTYVQCLPQGVYRPRNAQASPLYRLVEDHFEELERVWDERYEREYGFWRPVVRHVIEQFLDCGDLRCGFARLWCPNCRKDLLLPFSCRRRCFCPSCHQKRALLFAEHIDEEVLGDLPVRQYVVTIPKMLRLCFKYDRKLLGLLSQCFYASVKELFQDAVGDRRSLPGMIASLQSYGDDPTRFHPHLHSLVTDGLVSADGSLVPVPCPDPVCLMGRFRHKLIKALLGRQKILRHLKLWDRPERPPPRPAGRSIEYDEEIANFDEAG
jgi:hypothetical protein